MTTNAGREDYDRTLRMPMLAPGEPVFPLRAQDELTGETIDFWASLAWRRGVDPAVIEQALKQADATKAWPDRRLPDAHHLTEPERKQLAYELVRRAWHARDDNADPRILLAEVRAGSSALAHLRPIREAIFDRLFYVGETRGYIWTPPEEENYRDPFRELRRLVDYPLLPIAAPAEAA